MQTAALKNFWSFLNPAAITGPIFDKELRVSSRRRRNYLLRFIYIILLKGFISLFWYAALETARNAGAAFNTSRMSQAGLTITMAIVWFQFIATQLLAVVMLSTAISDEIYNKTLGVLMTTPITTFQIVMGKLLSKLLQLILLIGISLPLLAIIRVFGGVPWAFVITSLCINITAILFAGTLSLYFSVGGKRSYEVIIKTVFVLGLLYLFIPGLLTAAMSGHIKNFYIPEKIVMPFLLHTNPFFALQFRSGNMLSPGLMPYMLYVPIHCLVMLAISILLLLRSIVIVRRVALLQALGQSPADAKKERRARRKEKRTGKKNKPVPLAKQDGKIRPVKGSPIIWKEMRAPMIKGSKLANYIGLGLAIFGLLFTYIISIREQSLDQEYAHATYTIMFLLLSIVMSLVVSATMITNEKEARTWPILLSTSLDDWQILLGKAVGVFRRSSPVWAFLAAHMIIFTAIGYIHPVALFHLTILITGVTIFLTGSGLYFSSLLKRTTTAVVANIIFVLLLWIGAPIILGIHSDITHNEKMIKTCVSLNPVVQNGIMMYGSSGAENAGDQISRLRYDWPGKDNARFGHTTLMIFGTSMAYCLAGLFMAWRAKKRLRKNIC